jgi:U32 family peptidase
MARYFNHKPVELLAPAGNFEIFKGIMNLKCDAAYFGGKNLNMRLHRKDYNFSDAELKEAVNIAHSLGKKAYITVNNMYNNQELDQLKEFLIFLQEIKPDALIVQDLCVVSLIKEMNLDLQVHASVMMNVHNLESIYALQDLGVTRIVLSREASLSYSKYLNAKSDMELEYFIHGDMCVAHGGQCFYSGMLFGQSSNRGRCLKPCRWSYEIEQAGKRYPTSFPLAVKDMCMYENIPDLIDAGITSFKIEGRMRDINYLNMIINAYGDSIDRYIEDPLCYDRRLKSVELYENRKRDTSTAYAFGKPGLRNINSRYEGTGTLFSSGKVFSTATEEREINKEKLQTVRNKLEENKINAGGKTRLLVKVNNMQQAKICLDLKVDAIYLSGDVFLPDKPFSRKDIEELQGMKGNTDIFLCLPHMTFDMQVEEYTQFLANKVPLNGILVTNIGGARAFNDKELLGDYPLNILNNSTADFYKNMGLKGFTISPEADLSEVIAILKEKGAEAELIVHGSPTVMYMEHDLYENAESESTDLLYLVDEEGFKHPVHKDQFGRNHMLLYKNICYLPILDDLYGAGLRNFRLETAHLNIDQLKEVIISYQEALMNLDKCEVIYNEFTKNHSGLTLGSFAL